MPRKHGKLKPSITISLIKLSVAQIIISDFEPNIPKRKYPVKAKVEGDFGKLEDDILEKKYRLMTCRLTYGSWS